MSEIQDFWDDVHTRQDKISLTGSDGSTEIESLIINPETIAGKTILAVGIGTTEPIAFYQQKGATVYALDISSVARENAKPYTVGQFSPEDELPESTFDYVFSNNVCIHMSHDDFEAQFKKIIRSLMPDGTYALQFAHIDDTLSHEGQHQDGHWAIDLYKKDNLAAQKWGAVFRSPGKLLCIAKMYNARIAFLSPPVNHPYIHNIFGYTAHIKRI